MSPQPPGRQYRRTAIAGYYNDPRGKVVQDRSLDPVALPTNELASGETVVFPTTVAQYGLGCWDLFLETKDDRYGRGAEAAAEWLLQHMDRRGGIDASAGLRPGHSAMTQGEAASLLFRVGTHTGKDLFIHAAEQALELLLLTIEQGGTARHVGLDTYLEEDPTGKYPAVLNGWIFALFGLFDGVLVTHRMDIRAAFEQGCDTLVRNIRYYDTGFWSYYDLAGHFASPFYHDLHIAQLTVLADLSRRDELAVVARRWTAYRNSMPGLLKAVATKAMQKLREPVEGAIVR